MLIPLFRRLLLTAITIMALTLGSFSILYYKNVSELSQLPLLNAYIEYLSRVIHGDLGASLLNQQSALTLIYHALPITLELCILAIIFSHCFGIPLGLIAGVNLHKRLDKTINFFILLGLSTPTFWLALLLVTFFSFYLDWLPVNGRYSPEYHLPFVTGFMYIDLFFTPQSQHHRLFIDMIKHTILPVCALSIWPTAEVSATLRERVIAIMQENYIKAAATRELSRFTLVKRHILHNALPPLFFYLGLRFPMLFTLSMVVEIIFDWNGFGYLLIYSLYHQDFAIISAGVLVSGTLIMAIYLLVEIISMLFNPLLHRVHYAIQ